MSAPRWVTAPLLESQSQVTSPGCHWAKRTTRASQKNRKFKNKLSKKGTKMNINDAYKRIISMIYIIQLLYMNRYGIIDRRSQDIRPNKPYTDD